MDTISRWCLGLVGRDVAPFRRAALTQPPSIDLDISCLRVVIVGYAGMATG